MGMRADLFVVPSALYMFASAAWQKVNWTISLASKKKPHSWSGTEKYTHALKVRKETQQHSNDRDVDEPSKHSWLGT